MLKGTPTATEHPSGANSSRLRCCSKLVSAAAIFLTTALAVISRVFIELYFLTRSCAKHALPYHWLAVRQRYATAQEFQLLQGCQGAVQDGDAHRRHFGDSPQKSKSWHEFATTYCRVVEAQWFLRDALQRILEAIFERKRPQKSIFLGFGTVCACSAHRPLGSWKLRPLGF